jgi:hypothetical protein
VETTAFSKCALRTCASRCASERILRSFTGPSSTAPTMRPWTPARQQARAALYTRLGDRPDVALAEARNAGLAAWSLVHGLATLLLTGNLPLDVSCDKNRSRARSPAISFSNPLGGAVPSAGHAGSDEPWSPARAPPSIESAATAQPSHGRQPDE